MDAPPNLLQDLGNKVRNQRKLLGWTRRELAERAQISERFLADVERGRANPSLLRMAALAQALDLPLTALLEAPAPAPTSASVALLGLRGAGKSTVGALLAERLDYSFIELDAEVEGAVGLSLAEIFELHGADYYRSAEREVLREVLGRPQPVVLATGGGIVTAQPSYDLLRRGARTVWLRARPEDHWTRVVAQGDTRPMEGNERAFTHLCSILAERETLYRQADLTIDTSDRAPEQVAQDLAQHLLQAPEPAPDPA